MEAACRGAKSRRGLTIGLLPGLDRAEANGWVDVAIATGLGEIRNALIVRTSDALVAVGGGVGTLSEIGVRAEARAAGDRRRDVRGRGRRAGRVGRRGGGARAALNPLKLYQRRVFRDTPAPSVGACPRSRARSCSPTSRWRWSSGCWGCATCGRRRRAAPPRRRLRTRHGLRGRARVGRARRGRGAAAGRLHAAAGRARAGRGAAARAARGAARTWTRSTWPRGSPTGSRSWCRPVDRVRAASGDPAAASAPVSLGSATLEQLETLDGVGPATAQKIVAYRTRARRLSLGRRPRERAGIGPKKLAAIKPHVQP